MKLFHVEHLPKFGPLLAFDLDDDIPRKPLWMSLIALNFLFSYVMLWKEGVGIAPCAAKKLHKSGEIKAYSVRLSLKLMQGQDYNIWCILSS